MPFFGEHSESGFDCKRKGSQETQTQLDLDNLQEANDQASWKKYFMKYALEEVFL